MKGTVVLGGGLTGLSCARHLEAAGHEAVVLEREDRVGGVARTDKVDGFHFDHAGHLLHLRTDYGKALVRELFPDHPFHEIARRASIFSKGVYTDYPFQAKLFGLPPEVIRECLLGFIDVVTSEDTRSADDSFAQWCLKSFGKGIAKHFMIPFNEKMWRRDLEAVTTDWVSWSVPRPSLEEVVEGALGIESEKAFGYNPNFLYPKAGGIEVLAQRLQGDLPVRTQTQVVGVDLNAQTLTLSSGEELSWERLVSTASLKHFLERCSGLPEEVKKAGDSLTYVDVHVFNVGVRGEAPIPDHWVYVPEHQYPFYRVGVATNFAPAIAPDGHYALYVETSRRPDETVDAEALQREVLQALETIGLVPDQESIRVVDHLCIRPAYVVHDQHRREVLPGILSALEERGVHSVGRYGAWTYSSMEDALNHGREAAEKILGREAPLVSVS